MRSILCCLKKPFAFSCFFLFLSANILDKRGKEMDIITKDVSFRDRMEDV